MEGQEVLTREEWAREFFTSHVEYFSAVNKVSDSSVNWFEQNIEI